MVEGSIGFASKGDRRRGPERARHPRLCPGGAHRQGGMGVVYLAVQPLVEREVAIKIILPQYANHPDFIRRFEAEAQLVARLEHHLGQID